MTYLSKKALVTTMVLSGIVGLAGCETTNGTNNTVKKGAIGAAAGAVAGAVIGNNAGDGDAQSGALIGAVIGGAGGAYVGCRDDGGCGAQPNNNQYQQSGQYGQQPVQQPVQQIDKRQYYDQNTGRYYYYDPASKREYYENGDLKR
jgi:phage tail tape-measure protein